MGGVGQSPIPAQPKHMIKRGKSDVRDVVEGGHLRVGGEDPQVIPPLSSGGVPLKGERRMVPLRISSREVLLESEHLHVRGAMDVSGGVDGANPRSQLARPMSRHDPQEGVNRFGGGDKVGSPQLGEGQLQLLRQVCGPPLLAERTRTLWVPHVNMDEGGGGVQTLCPLNHLPHKRPPVYVASSNVCGRRGRPTKWAWVLAARLGRLPCCERSMAREIRAAQGDESMERC